MNDARARVAHVMEAMHRGGAETLVLEHVRHAAPGVEVIVCALNRGGPALEEARALGARTFLLGPGRGPRVWRMVDRIVRLARLLHEQRVTFVNGHNPTGGLYAIAAARLAGIPGVRTEHSLHYGGRHSVGYLLIEPLLTVLSRRVVCVCRAVLESHVRRLPWAARRFVTVANGISPSPRTRPRQAVRESLGLDPGARVVLTVGSLTPQKAHHVLIDAFQEVAGRFPDAVLLVAGDGPRRESLESRVRDAGLGGRVRFLGDRADAGDLLEACDVFVLSSAREGLPVTVLEAMRAGRPVVATAVGGCAEAVASGETGLVVPPGDPASLARAIAEVLGDRSRAAAWGAAGRERWARHFTAERMVRETEALYGFAIQERATAEARGGPVSHVAS
jgi:glycosyltransferase involved in cell wall biosynthesis